MTNDQSQTWLIYSLGGGWGHLTRALSLGRIAATKRKVRILTNSPYAVYMPAEGCEIQAIAADAGFTETCERVRDILLKTDYSCLIVDTFPRGLGGELVDILPRLQNIPRILIHRDINPNYVRTKKLRSFVAQNFDSVIVPGEGEDLPLSDLPMVRHTAPWLIRNADELSDTVKMRAIALGRGTAKLEHRKSLLMKVDESVKMILVCAAGNESELSFFGQLAMQLNKAFSTSAVRILAPSCPVGCSPALWISHTPGIECLAAADVVVGGAGYNTVYECAAVGVPLVAFAFKRLYDQQDRRASKSAYWVRDVQGGLSEAMPLAKPDVVQPGEQSAAKRQEIQAIATIGMLLDQVELRTQPRQPRYTNGAVQAMRQIEQIISCLLERFV